VEVESMNPVEDYLSELKLFNRSIGYVKNVDFTLKNFQTSCNVKNILDVNEDAVKLFIQYLREKGIKERTINDYIKNIERFYFYVIESKKYGLTDNPAKRIAKKLNFKKTQTKRPIKTLDEVSKFIKNIHNPRDRAIVVLFAKTGIRNGELTALNIEDIDFNDELLKIDKHINNLSSNTTSKGRKNKNETVIPLDDETIRTLKFYLISRPKKVKSNALFVSQNGNRLYEMDISKLVKDWGIKTGIGINSNETDKKITPHFFRAWLTYMLHMNGCNPIVIDAIRGDVAATIRDFYTNQVLPFDVIKKEYLKAVPKFGI
jgi:integrase